MRIQNRTPQAVSFAILLSVFVLAVMSAEERYVAGPGLACIIMVLWLWMTLWERDQKVPFFDVGMFCALATMFYTIYPLVNYWVDGLQFGILSDYRLQSYHISPAELGFFHLRHVLYLFSFVVFYSMFRDKGKIEVGNVGAPSRSQRQVIFIFFLLLTGYFFALQLVTGVSYNTSYEPEAFAKNMAAFAKMPLLLLQISTKLVGILFVFKMALLYIVVSRCRQKKWVIIILAWIAVEIIQAVYIKGARSGLVLFLMATALFYHRMIKPLTTKYLVTSGAILLALFMFLGLYRSYTDVADMQDDLSRSKGGMLSSVNEFQALLGTAYDVYRRKEAGAELPWYLYINDFITILPPQQIMPFKKVPAADWYLQEIGLSGKGIGFMWGVISQSIIGLDWFELALRGAILGFILARFHRRYLKHKYKFLETLLYVYMCLKVYYTFRDTTFSLLAFLVWEIGPFYLFIRVTSARDIRKSLPRYKSMLTHVRNLRKNNI